MSYDAKKVAGQKLDILRGRPPANAYEATNVILFRDIDGKFATTTNGAIVKKSNGEVLPDDEPLFLFRARDHHAIAILDFYRKLCNEEVGSNWHVSKMGDIVQDFRDFAKENPERMKQPGVTRGL